MALDKTITYDHGDYRAELDGQLIGFYPNYHTAETELNRAAFDWLTHGYCATATELDGAQADDLPPTVPPAAAPLPYTAEEIAEYNQIEPCKMNVIGTRWTICGAPSDGPCYCDVVVIAQADDDNDPPEEGPCDDIDQPIDRPRCACGADATWEVPFATEPHYEYFCDACFPSTYYMGEPITSRAILA